eukprot:365891-Chlamydomonas_euryale.AAC.13
MMHFRNACHDVTLEMDESILAKDLIHAATPSGCWEQCDGNAGKFRQVACGCYLFRRLQLQGTGVSGANWESDVIFCDCIASPHGWTQRHDSYRSTVIQDLTQGSTVNYPYDTNYGHLAIARKPVIFTTLITAVQYSGKEFDDTFRSKKYMRGITHIWGIPADVPTPW